MEPGTPHEEKKLPFNNLFLNAGVVNGYNYWWMYIFGVLSCILGYLVFQLVMIGPLIEIAKDHGISMNELLEHPNILFDPERIGINKNLLLCLVMGMFVFALLGLYLSIVRLHRKPFKSIITGYDRVRWGRFFFAFGLWSLWLIIFSVLAYFTSGGSVQINFKPAEFFMLLLISVVFIPIQSSTEEFLFRGYLVQGLSQVFKNGIVPVLVTSALFGAAHMDNPEAKTFGAEIMFPYYTLFGFFLGAITLLDEGLELALGIHVANNLITGLMVTTPSGVLKTDAIFITAEENPASDFIGWVIMATVTFIIFWLKYRWKNFNLLIK